MYNCDTQDDCRKPVNEFSCEGFTAPKLWLHFSLVSLPLFPEIWQKIIKP